VEPARNMRVQRSRSSPQGHRAPRTGRPLDRREGRYAIGALCVVSLRCARPTVAPVTVAVTGPAGYPVEASCGPKHADVALLERITPRMSIGEITDILGPPARESGSAVVVMEWDCTDGRRFYVSTNQSGPCSTPVELGFTK